MRRLIVPFIPTYNELVANERRKMQMVPEVRKFIASKIVLLW